MNAKKNPDIISEKDENSKADFTKLTQEAMNTKASEIAPSETKANTLSESDINKIINSLATTHGITNVTALCAVFLLFLKGAANNGAPLTMSVDVIDSNGTTTITKYDVKYAYQRVTQNEFIRRLAESLAKEIGTYAEKNFLSGDIAAKIDSRIMAMKDEKDRIPLSSKERAWASSFSQRISNLAELSSSRLPQLLATDYNERFAKKSKKESKGKGGNTPVPSKKNDMKDNKGDRKKK